MEETLQEFCTSRGVRMGVDRDAGMIRGVKILGLESRNGRTYLPEALAEAAAMYEGAKVNVNHPKGSPAAPRDYQDRIGAVRNVAVRAGEGLFGDLHFNPRHALAEQLAWDAEHAPENVGFSHNVQARTSRRGERTVVEAITEVRSVDLVADPATTRGLFESAAEPERGAWSALTLEDLSRHRPDLVEAIREEQAAESRRLEAEVRRLQEAEAGHRKRLLAGKLLRQFRLPDPDTADPSAKAIVSDCFMESLLAADDEAAMRRLVEDRARLAGGRPSSRDQNLADSGRGRFDAKQFAAAIKR
ncbi:MAG: hypothetical protein ACYC35_23950 [Pirellulales bacterium]